MAHDDEGDAARAPAAVGEEVEWQLDAPELGAVERWLDALPAGAAPGPTHVGAPRPALIEDIYLDTDDRRLRGAGYALRVRGRRRDGELRVEATLKSLGGGDAGLRRREERNEPLPDAVDAASAARDPAALCAAGGPVGRRVRALAGPQPLREILRIYTDRRTRELRAGGAGAGAGGTEVGELAIDRCALLPPPGPAKHLERVEVELTPGAEPAALERLVAALSRACALRPASASKLEFGLGPDARGAEATGSTPPRAAGALTAPPASRTPVEAGGTRPAWPPPLRRRARMAESARAALAGPLAMLAAVEPIARAGADAEGVHDMRVAARRLRAALALYGDALPPGARAQRRELRWLGSALGEVRDLDVQLARIERQAAAGGSAAPEGGAAWAPLARLLARRRDEARERRLLPALDGERYPRMLAELRTLVEEPRRDARAAATTDRAGRAARERAAAALRPALARRGRRLERALARAGPSASAERHHLARIEAKRARYAIECCAALYGRPARRAIAALRRLQELLGAERDASAAADALRQVAASAEGAALPPSTLYAMGELAARARSRAGAPRRAPRGSLACGRALAAPPPTRACPRSRRRAELRRGRSRLERSGRGRS